jgi:DNA-binding transcriptional regulator YiaG
MPIDIREATESGDHRTSKASAPAMHFDPQKLEAIDFQISCRIRLRRRQLGMSQSDLARAIGVTFQQVHKYETGQSAVTAARLYAIAPSFPARSLISTTI